MRQPTPRYDLILVLLGQLIKFLFVGLFICTVLVVLAGIFGVGEPALMIYGAIWGFFWRISMTLVAFLAIFILFDSLQ